MKCFVLRFCQRIIVGWEAEFVCVHMRGKWGERKYRRLRGEWEGEGSSTKKQKIPRNNVQQRILKIKEISVIMLINLCHLKNAITNSYRSHEVRKFTTTTIYNKSSTIWGNFLIYFMTVFYTLVLFLKMTLNFKIALFELVFLSPSKYCCKSLILFSYIFTTWEECWISISKSTEQIRTLGIK